MDDYMIIVQETISKFIIKYPHVQHFGKHDSHIAGMPSHLPRIQNMYYMDELGAAQDSLGKWYAHTV